VQPAFGDDVALAVRTFRPEGRLHLVHDRSLPPGVVAPAGPIGRWLTIPRPRRQSLFGTHRAGLLGARAERAVAGPHHLDLRPGAKLLEDLFDGFGFLVGQVLPDPLPCRSEEHTSELQSRE